MVIYSLKCAKHFEIQYNQHKKMNFQSTQGEKIAQKRLQVIVRKENLKKSLSLKVKSRKSSLWQKSCPEISQKQTIKESKQGYSSLEDIINRRDQKVAQDFGKFFIMKGKIGEGCHSSVYNCEEICTGKKYAVKVMKKTDTQLFPSIRQTYRIMSKLNHSSIAKTKLLFINEKIKTCHLVQQICQYPDLGQFMRKNPKTESSKTANILKDLLKAVAYMHSEGACHRDIKPQNIMYCPQTQKIKLIDFQLSRRLKYSQDNFQMFTKTGTLHYRAPEIFTSLYDEKVDIWAVGVVAYQLFTGKLPFSGYYQPQVINKILTEQPNFDELSSEQKQLLKKLLCKKPQQRVSASDALTCKYFLLHTDDNRNEPKSTSDCNVRSPSAGKQIPKKTKKNDLKIKNRFYDDDVTEMFLGAQEDCGIVRYGETSFDTDAESPY